MIKIAPEYIYENETIEDYENRLYVDFRNNFIDKNNRVKFNNTFIFVDTPFIDGKSKQFYHLIGLDVSNRNHKFQCNDNSSQSCISQCNNTAINLPFYPERAHCMYRLARLNYVHKIIQLANNQDSRVKAWKYYKYNAQNQRENLSFLFYSSNNENYFVVLKDLTNRRNPHFKFVAAYPILDPDVLTFQNDNYACAVTRGNQYY